MSNTFLSPLETVRMILNATLSDAVQRLTQHDNNEVQYLPKGIREERRSMRVATFV